MDRLKFIVEARSNAGVIVYGFLTLCHFTKSSVVFYLLSSLHDASIYRPPADAADAISLTPMM